MKNPSFGPLKETEFYWLQIRRWAKKVKSDGCSGVPDFYRDACLEHDYHYANAKTWYGDPVTRAQADARFRKVIQWKSPFGIFSPMSWWRWAGLRLFGEAAWEAHRLKETR